MLPRARLRRAVVAFAIGLLVVLPVSAAAAPAAFDAVAHGNGSGNSQGDEGDNGGLGDAPSGSDDAPGRSGDAPSGSDDAPGRSGDAPSGSGDAPGRSGDAPSGSGDAPGRSGDAPSGSDDAPGRSGDAPSGSDDAPGRSGDAPGRLEPTDELPGRSGLAPGRVDGPPPPGLATQPTPGVPPGLARDVGAAFVMLELPNDEELVVLVTPAEPGGLSGELVSVLSPVMPTALVEAVTSPIVIFEALLEAMASSGQALVIPFLAAGIAFFMPGLRRRDVIAAVIDES